MDTLSSSIVFLLVTGLLFFIPGIFLLFSFFGSWRTLSPFESLVLSFGLSVGLINFLLIVLGKLGILFTPTSILLGIAVSTLAAALGAWLIRRFDQNYARNLATKENAATKETFAFSKKQTALFILLLVLTFAIKTIYLADAVLPTSTDLGHHMYWAKLITETGKLPQYAELGIITNSEGNY